MGWLIALCIIGLLLILPIGVSARYDLNGALVRLILGPIRLTVFPRKKKSKSDNAKEEKANKQP